MVGNHQIDRPIFEPLPQFLAILTAANRRRAFAQRRSLRNRLGREMQVVWTGLHAHGKSLVARSAQFLKRLAGREMNNVQTKTVFAAQRQHQPDGGLFRFVGPRLKIRRITTPICVSQSVSCLINWTRKFRMHQERQASPSNMGQSRPQLLLRDHGKTIDARIDQKTFEPQHSGGGESFNVTLIIVDYPTPCRPIDAASAACSRPLGCKRSDSRRRGKAVKGHIDKQRIASRRRGLRRGFETLPLRAAGIVDMHMRIDKPRQDGRFAEVVDAATLRYLIGSNNGLDALTFHQNGRRADAFGSNYTASKERLQTQNGNSFED